MEELRGQLRSLKSQNRQLKKMIGRLEKRAHRAQDLEEFLEDLEPEVNEEPKVNSCSCGGKIEKVDLGVRTLFKCSTCGKRETKKK